ncbi:MAG: hypothetical protein ACN6O8_15700 [Achromobacter sp.]|uniref:hypothetical protein n=1 Tax=Achromobacter sp. TaxID=134375 RepID=UPI003CFF9B56
MRVSLAVASLLAVLLYFVFSAPCGRAADPGERPCRGAAFAQGGRGGVLWSLGNRFSLLNLPLRAL